MAPAPTASTRSAIPRFDHDTAQAWVERIAEAREALALAEHAGFITDHETAQQLDRVLAETHTVARALRNTIDEHHARLTKLERDLEQLRWPLEILRHPLLELGKRRNRRGRRVSSR